jgi:hypothetical protein
MFISPHYATDHLVNAPFPANVAVTVTTPSLGASIEYSLRMQFPPHAGQPAVDPPKAMLAAVELDTQAAMSYSHWSILLAAV